MKITFKAKFTEAEVNFYRDFECVSNLSSGSTISDISDVYIAFLTGLTYNLSDTQKAMLKLEDDTDDAD